MWAYTTLFLMLGSVAIASPVRDLQHEIKLSDSGWRVTKEDDYSISWVTPTPAMVGITLTLKYGFDSMFPGANGLTEMQDAYRTEAKSIHHGALVEAERRFIQGIGYNLVTMKFHTGAFRTPPNDLPGFAYQINAIIPTTRSKIILQVGASERGTTGLRESTCLIIYMKESHISDLRAASKLFWRDPYDHRFDEGALYNVGDERRFDASFPDHPLTKCREHMEKLLGSIVLPESVLRNALEK